MILRDALADYLHDFLLCDDFMDYAPNGVQVEGANEISHLCTAVTASADVIKRAAEFGAEALLVHHGYFWKGEALPLVGMKRERIKQLIVPNINLFAYHLPLDCHPTIGNNARLAQIFDLRHIKMHSIGKIPNLLWSGCFDKPKTPEVLLSQLQEKLNRNPLHLRGTKKIIKSLAWCSGGAQDYITEAAALGVDAYLSGEVSERTYYHAMELGIHYFAGGHHATERFGVQALGEHLAGHFGIKHQFLDTANPI